jgi:hypothetical protein
MLQIPCRNYKAPKGRVMGELMVNMGNGVKVEVEYIGTAKLHLASGHFLDLKGTAFVPSIRRNLIFISLLDKCGYIFEFGNGMVAIYYDSIMVGSGILCDGLYKIDLMPSLSYLTSNTPIVSVVVGSKCSRASEISSMLWHRRLGHISRPRTERLIKDGILANLDFSDFDTCVKGKFTIKTRRQKDGRSENVLELIHADICGPITPAALGNYRYFITFIDNYSHYDYIKFIREKSESLEAFKNFKAIVELQRNKKIKAIRSNRGDEYYGRYDETGQNAGPFARFLEAYKIEAQYTMLGTPQQNGVAERRNCTLMDMV